MSDSVVAEPFIVDTPLPIVLDALDTARNAALSLHTQVEAAEQHLQNLRQELEAICAQRDRWESQCRIAWEQTDSWRVRTMQAREQANEMRDHVLRMHADLRAEDLPSLILRTCLALTHAEQGFLTEPDGDGLRANIGLEELTHIPLESLYAFTRQVAESGKPMVRNDGANLPDGPQLVNLAAVPVSLHGQHSGVLLVANKRQGPFTEEDTDLLLSVGRHAGVALENQRLHGELTETHQATIAVLADAILLKDPYTRGHCEAVANLAVRVAQRLGLKGDDLERVRYAALLHDVGKIGISDGILLKPGALLPEERSIVERHPQIGHDLVTRVAGLGPIAPLIRHHHERIDGQGYPDGLNGEAIPMIARIICVVDALDAMTSPRPYRRPVSRSEAMEELRRCAGQQFDSEVVTVLEEMLAGEQEAEL